MEPIATEPGWRPPMLAQNLREEDRASVFRSGDWTFERKLDGLRCVAVRDGNRVELWSRNHLSFNGRFPAIVASIRAIGVDRFVLDGEVVAFDGDRTTFSLLQEERSGAHPVFCAFDLLHLLGHDTTGLPLFERTALLSPVVEAGPETIRAVDRLEGDPVDLMTAACAQGWEGLIAKKRDSIYTAGRSGDWRKLKCSARQELVIGGWTEPSGARSGFGALVVGYFEDGRLLYAGKVGTGFSQATLGRLSGVLRSLATDASPFAEPVPLRKVHWVRPEVVAEVEFAEWTPAGRLRHPRFLGIRPDKKAHEVRREVHS